MKKTFTRIFLPLIFTAFFFSCESNNSSQDNGSQKDTLVVVQDTAGTSPDTAKDGVQAVPEQPAAKPKPETKPKTETKPEPEKTTEAPKPDWRTMLNEYHEILCKNHKGQGTTDDKIRQAELLRELTIEGRKLKSSEKFAFTAGMARAVNMESCK